MGVTYGVDDTTGTYQVGKQTSGLSEDADASGTTLNTRLDAVTPGSRHGASVLNGGIDNLKLDAKGAVSTLSNGVKNLGNGTSNVSTTVVDTQNETTGLHNSSGALSRHVNGTMHKTIAV